ncbi:Pre-Mrna-Splicing Factor Slu7 [Manis pentadactyla]|nr:Pre-Mrna-Splicing Factor Slu7 [Manis pentadactyla]
MQTGGMTSESVQAAEHGSRTALGTPNNTDPDMPKKRQNSPLRPRVTSLEKGPGGLMKERISEVMPQTEAVALAQVPEQAQVHGYSHSGRLAARAKREAGVICHTATEALGVAYRPLCGKCGREVVQSADQVTQADGAARSTLQQRKDSVEIPSTNGEIEEAEAFPGLI